MLLVLENLIARMNLLTLLTAALATRVGGPVPANAEPDSRARLWFLLQKWF